MNKDDIMFAVVNPTSANGRTRKIWPSYLEQLRSLKYNLDYAFTSKPEDAVEITQQALDRGYRRIISVGGDGTLNEVVNGFFRAGEIINPLAELAVLSHGTGGDFLRTLNLAKGLEGLVAVLQRSRVLTVDVGRVEFLTDDQMLKNRYFLNVADVGLGGETVACVNKQSKFLGGKISFMLGSIRTILSYKNKEMTCEIDGKIVAQGKLNSIMAANGRYIGGGMMIAPNAGLADGLFDVVILGDLSTWKLLWHLPKIYRGKHLKVPGVSVYKGRQVRVESQVNVLLDVDGEQPGSTPVTFSIITKAIRLLT